MFCTGNTAISSREIVCTLAVSVTSTMGRAAVTTTSSPWMTSSESVTSSSVVWLEAIRTSAMTFVW